MKREIPILFSTMMVQALLAGRKTQTRRVIKNATITESEHPGLYNYEKKNGGGINSPKDQLSDPFFGIADVCPYGKPGDVLWVREEFYQYGHWEKDHSRKRKSGRQAWKFVADDSEILYSDNPPANFRKGRHHKDPNPEIPTWYKRMPRFMPKAAARIWLEVEERSVERVQDISEADAVAEGVENFSELGLGEYTHRYKNYQRENSSILFARNSFQTLWFSIHSEKSWEANPWLWVIKFKVLSTTGRPSI